MFQTRNLLLRRQWGRLLFAPPVSVFVQSHFIAYNRPTVYCASATRGSDHPVCRELDSEVALWVGLPGIEQSRDHVPFTVM